MKPQKINYFLFFILLLTSVGLAQASPNPVKPFPPFRIAGNLYYVGNDYQASYLIATAQGNILINSDYEVNVPLLQASIEKLGFKFSDTKILLISHAHADHDGGSALIKEKTGARYMVMDADVPVVESGGKADFHYGQDAAMFYPVTSVDHVLRDGEPVQLGNSVVVAHLTPGHTKGCTTWTMKVTEQGRSYHAVIVGSPYVNPGYKLVHNSAYPAIAQDYQQMFRVLKSLPCDIFLGAHGIYFGLEEKYARMKNSAPHPFVDPEGYKKFVAQTEQEFYLEWAKQKNA